MRFLTSGSTPKIEQAASRDDSRPVLTRPWLLVDKPKKGQAPTSGRVVACDSYILAVVPVEFNDQEKPAQGAIEGKVFAEGRKHEKRFSESVQLLADKTTVLGSEATFPPPDPNVGQYPDVDRLMPAEDAISHFHVGLNATLLKRLADSLGSEGVLLEFVVDKDVATAKIVGGVNDGNEYRLPTNMSGIRVRPLHSKGEVADGPVGLMMPIQVKG